MKIFFFLLISTFLFAQETTYIDTIFTYKNKPYPCLVESISERYISFTYLNRIKDRTLTDGVAKLVIDSLGTIYTKELGYSYNLDEINNKLKKRNKTLLKPNRIKNTNMYSTKLMDSILQRQSKKVQNIIDISKNEDYLWSFGFVYTPFYTGKIYNARLLDYENYSLSIEPKVTNYSIMSGEFSYKIFDKLRFTVEMSYTSTTFEFLNSSTYKSLEDKTRYANNNNNIEKFIFLNIGAKWYFKNFVINGVTPFIAIKFGKQFAIIEHTSKMKRYPNNYINNTDDNKEDFLQQLNSPFFISSSFGVEYYFSKSLSLISNMEISYSSASSLFKSRTINENYESTKLTEFSISHINTKFGIGLNFYF